MIQDIGSFGVQAAGEGLSNLKRDIHTPVDFFA